jgi:hypothetical protein
MNNNPTAGITRPFLREERYYVLKISDMRKYLSREKFEFVGAIAEKLNAGRAVDGKTVLQAVVVEHDWPEYERVWQMIADRMQGESHKGAPVAREWPIMGYGNVAIGGGRNKADGNSYLLYLKLDEPREINTDTTDVFPVGQEAPQEKLLACIYFKDGAAMQQTIEVLQEMQAEIGYTTPPQRKPLTDEQAWKVINQVEQEFGGYVVWDMAEPKSLVRAILKAAHGIKE